MGARPNPSVLVILAGCTSPQYKAFLEEYGDQAGAAVDSSGDGATTSDPSPTSTGETGSEGADATGDTSEATDTAPLSDSATDTATDTDDGTDTGDSSPVGEPEEPVIVSVDLPAKVYAAGPVPLAVQTMHTEAVHVTLDGVDAGELIPAGGGLFTGRAACSRRDR